MRLVFKGGFYVRKHGTCMYSCRLIIISKQKAHFGSVGFVASFLRAML